jgi:hypothetical protein
MNFTATFNGNLDGISTEQVILSQKDIYRKIINLDNSYDIFYLTLKDNHFVWEKYSSNIIPYGSSIENINILSVLLDKNNNFNFIIFKTNGFKIVTHKIQINNEGIFSEWENVTPETNNFLMNQYILSTQLKDIPTHIDLTNEYLSERESACPSDQYDILNEYEPLNGWENFEIPSFDNIPSDISVKTKSDETKSISFETKSISLEDIYEEMRIDPYDGNWYTKYEFRNYYSGLNEWDHQEPKKILMREEIHNFTEKYSDISDKKFIFMFKEYVKTFE